MVGSSFCHNVDKINRIYDKNMIYILTSLIMVREDCKIFTYHVPPLAEEQQLSEIDSISCWLFHVNTYVTNCQPTQQKCHQDLDYETNFQSPTSLKQ